MKFEEALALMRQGKTLKLRDGKARFHISRNGKLMIGDGDVIGAIHVLGIEYILAEDWEEVEE